jgi:hypothetical protein
MNKALYNKFIILLTLKLLQTNRGKGRVGRAENFEGRTGPRVWPYMSHCHH